MDNQDFFRAIDWFEEDNVLVLPNSKGIESLENFHKV